MTRPPAPKLSPLARLGHKLAHALGFMRLETEVLTVRHPGCGGLVVVIYRCRACGLQEHAQLRPCAECLGMALRAVEVRERALEATKQDLAAVKQEE